jgi:hypothetical protein
VAQPPIIFLYLFRFVLIDERSRGRGKIEGDL